MPCSAAFASTKRAYSSAFASAGGSEAALCDPLAAIPARVRTFMNGHRLETALTQLAKLDASAKVRSAVEGARVMYQRRIASIRTELLRDKAAICHGQISAPRFVTLCNGLLASNGGRVSDRSLDHTSPKLGKSFFDINLRHTPSSPSLRANFLKAHTYGDLHTLVQDIQTLNSLSLLSTR